MSDIDSLLDSSIDDLADLPEFAVFPNGVHRVTINFESKKVNEHPSVELKMKLLETVEMADATATPLEPGAESSVLYMLDNEFGQGKLKAVISSLRDTFGGATLKEVMENANGAEVTVVCKVRQNKDKTQSYTDVTKVMV